MRVERRWGCLFEICSCCGGSVFVVVVVAVCFSVCMAWFLKRIKYEIRLGKPNRPIGEPSRPMSISQRR